MHPDELAYGRDLILRLVCKQPSFMASLDTVPRRVMESPILAEDRQMTVMGADSFAWLTLRKD